MSGILSGSDDKRACGTPISPSSVAGLLSGAIITGGTFNISVNSTQSSKLPPTWYSTTNIQAAKRKRAIIESDSDDD